jgi:hypothetical protein
MTGGGEGRATCQIVVAVYKAGAGTTYGSTVLKGRQPCQMAANGYKMRAGTTYGQILEVER